MDRKRIRQVVLGIGAWAALQAGGNLCPNPGFEGTSDRWQYGGSFGADAGFVRMTDTERTEGKRSLQFHKDGPRGGAQIFCVLKDPKWRDAQKASVELSMQHKGGGMLVFIQFYHPETDKPLMVKDKKMMLVFSVPEAKDWRRFTYRHEVPAQTLKRAPLFRLQIQKYGTGDSFLDEVSFRYLPVGGEPIVPPPLPLLRDWLAFYEVGEPTKLPPVKGLPFAYGIRDGVLTKDGKAHFYTGNSTFGGGQYTPEGMWLARLLNYSMVTLDWGVMASLKEVDKRIEVRYPDAAPSVSMFRELARNGLIVEHDTGDASFNSMHRKLCEAFPQLKDYVTSTSHYYSYDHNTEIGRKFHVEGWKNRYRYLQGLPVMATEIYNELGYTPSHERVRRGFRAFCLKKYGTLEEACKVWGKSFDSWDEVLPPHLSEDILPGAQSHGYRLKMVKKYWKMNYDWLRFLQLDLAPGLEEMRRQFHEFSSSPVLIDWRGFRGLDDDGYGAVDPDLLSRVTDMNSLHTGFYLFDYCGEPADETTVLSALTHNAMHPDFVASNNRKATINPECIISRTSIPRNSFSEMKKHSFKDFSCPWKFTLEQDASGVEKGYFQPGFDDSSWGTMAVPGCWDETERYRDQKGFGWYRTTFKVPGILKADSLDGSRRFCIYGKGVAQRGTIWVNGVKVGTPKGWETIYKYDVTPYLKYGGENQITVMVEGSNYANGLRFYIHVLPEDKIMQNRLLRKGDYASLLWTHMMHGLSAVVLWHWDDTWRPFMAELNQELNQISDVVMSGARNRTSRIAMLMPFLYFRGLPSQLSKYYQNYMRYYAGLMFNQAHAKILTEQNMRRITPESHPLALYPFARIVQPETYWHFKRYVEQGGTAVVTLDSLLLDFERYGTTGLDQYLGIKGRTAVSGTPAVIYGGKRFATAGGDMCAVSGVRLDTTGTVLARYEDGTAAVVEVRRGRGRVILVGANLKLGGVHTLLKELLHRHGIRPEVEILDSGARGEFPYLEAQVVGNADRFLLYLHNWGGKSRQVKVRLPYKGRYIQRNVRKLSERRHMVEDVFSGQVCSSEPGAWLFEREGTSQLPMKGISPAKRSLLERLGSLRENPKSSQSSRPKVLFAEVDTYVPKMALRLSYPHLTTFFRRAGAETWGRDPAKVTAEELKKYRCVVLMETEYYPMKVLCGANQGAFIKLLLEYVEHGGNLLVCASSMGSVVNSYQSIWWSLGGRFGVSAGEYLRDDKSCGYGDPYQVRLQEFGAHPVTQGLQAVQLFVSRAFRVTPKSSMRPILHHRGKPVMVGGTYGKGKVILATDVLWMQPLRIERDDNARLLSNITEFMLNQPVTNASHEELRKHLVLTEDQLRKMEAEER